MPRPLLIRSETYPYYVTSEVHSQKSFPIPLNEIWEIFMEKLKLEMVEHSLVLYALVLMNHRFHLLCQTPDKNLDVIMQRFLRTTSLKINSKSEISTPLWRGRYRWSLIDDHLQFIQVYRYIYQYPVRERFCAKVEDYPYSTLKPCTLTLSEKIFESPKISQPHLEWLNECPDEEATKTIRLGLRRASFHIGRRRLKLFQTLSSPPRLAVEEEKIKNLSLLAP